MMHAVLNQEKEQKKLNDFLYQLGQPQKSTSKEMSEGIIFLLLILGGCATVAFLLIW